MTVEGTLRGCEQIELLSWLTLLLDIGHDRWSGERLAVGLEVVAGRHLSLDETVGRRC
ncbi:hypothetical protein ACIA8R_43710 [Nonomuraea sp. NPDC051191]|uniref:hypothetical protein n=1 Tax=Nonomuraea sp. NPDC051191 TaxID=3364372 RepID=UPI0037A20F99